MKLIAPYFDSYEGQAAEQKLLIHALEKIGIIYTPWDAREGNIPEANAIFWQAMSGYFHEIDRFDALLKQVEIRKIPSFNSINIMRWNARKTYLQTLEAKGVLIIPTLWLDVWDEKKIKAFSEENNYSELIIKPMISAGAYLTFRVKKSEEMAFSELKNIYQKHSEMPLMVQPFCPQIIDEGEWSLMYFDGEFSHAVIKTPKEEDYRIQHVHGGKYHRVYPPIFVKETAEKIISLLPEKPLYARVDGVVVGKEFWLMEIELIEPYFYLDAAIEQADMFAKAVHKVIR